MLPLIVYEPAKVIMVGVWRSTSPVALTLYTAAPVPNGADMVDAWALFRYMSIREATALAGRRVFAWDRNSMIAILVTGPRPLRSSQKEQAAPDLGAH